jgi:hypothetical protein
MEIHYGELQRDVKLKNPVGQPPLALVHAHPNPPLFDRVKPASVGAGPLLAACGGVSTLKHRSTADFQSVLLESETAGKRNGLQIRPTDAATDGHEATKFLSFAVDRPLDLIQRP